MNSRDYSAVTAVGVLALALAAIVAPFGLDIPPAVVGAVPIVAALALAGARLYVAIVGAANTTVDETVDAITRNIERLASKAKGTNVPPNR